MDDPRSFRLYLPGRGGNLCTRERPRGGRASARSFKVISPGLLPPLGIIFALFVAFTASQVWTDTEKAKAEIDREASALRTVVILATTFPREAEAQLRGLIRRYIADAATQEWAMMANRTANLRAI